MDDLHALRSEIATLHQRLAELQSRLDAATPDAADVGVSAGASRRGLLRVAAGVAVGAAVAGTAARPAAAATGQAMNAGHVNWASNRTELRVGNSNNTTAGSALTTNSVAFSVDARDPNTGLKLGAIQGSNDGVTAAIFGSNVGVGDGVHGRALTGDGVTAESGSGAGVRSFSGDGPGVAASSTTGVGLVASAPVSLQVIGTNPTPPSARPAFTGVAGMITPDGNGDLWLCVQAGTPGTWRTLGGPGTAGAFYPIAPQRVYDSRHGDGRMAPNTNRTVSVADGIDSSGAVVAVGAVPPTASAVACNVTVSGPTGPNFLSVVPGGATGYTTSTINFPGGFDCANGSVCLLGPDRTLTVFCGDQPGSTHVIIDVTGFYA